MRDARLRCWERVGICLGGEVGLVRFGDDGCRRASDRRGGRLGFGFGVGWLGDFAEGWGGIGLGAGRLHDAERAEGAVRGAHHEGRLAMAATGRVGVQADALGGKVEAVHGPGVGCDGARGEPGFLGIHGVERDDRGDGRFIARGALFGEVAEWRRKCLGQDEQGVAGDGAREEGQGVDEGHGVAAPARVRGLTWMLGGENVKVYFP